MNHRYTTIEREKAEPEGIQLSRGLPAFCCDCADVMACNHDLTECEYETDRLFRKALEEYATGPDAIEMTPARRKMAKAFFESGHEAAIQQVLSRLKEHVGKPEQPEAHS